MTLAESTGTQAVVQANPPGGFPRRDGADVRLLPGPYLPGLGFVRPNRACQQNRRPAADQVLRMGPSEFPGPKIAIVIGAARAACSAPVPPDPPPHVPPHA